MDHHLPSPRSAEAPPVTTLDLTGSVAVLVVDVVDWLDAASAAEVEAALRAALDARPERLAVDLSRCVMADPYGLGMLARMRALARARGTSLALVGANARVRRVLRLVGLADTLPVVDRAALSRTGLVPPQVEAG